ncbi:MAG: hypothetical protein NTY99_01020 [DPANN group archaeon]|nr:hypothetical protein [DPANN group archaeon]
MAELAEAANQEDERCVMADLDEQARKELFLRYKKKIEEQVGQPADIKEEPEVSYSQAYEIFRKEQLGVSHTLFENFCNSAEKTLKINLKASDIERIQPALEMAHIRATPQGVYALATISTIIIVFVSFIFGILLGNITILVAGMLAAVSLFFVVPTIPKRIFMSWRAKAGDQIILAVLYMIIYMEHTPNLELATWFAAKHLPPPLSLDFIKVLWDIETKKYSNITAALEDYVESWRGWDDAFIESVHVMETSLVAETKQERLKTLEKAEEIILDGTFDKMMGFAHNLQSPIQTVHMLGTVLPVMGLVMLPMVSAFMGASVKWWHLALMYNILLPISVYAISRSILSVRPAGANPADVYLHLTEKYSRPKIPPKIVGFGAASLVAVPAIMYFALHFPTGAEAFATTPLLFSVMLIAAIGVGIGVYYGYKVHTVIKIKKKIMHIEEEFSSAIFQLGSKIGEGVPVEAAFSSVIDSMPKADVTDFFRIIDRNIREEGMSLKEAIFNEKNGALAYYPSAIIKSVMQTLVEAAKKSPEIAASSLITISRYLVNAHRVNERLQDLLADTTSSMSMQIKMFAPVISGIVVGLSALTTSILSNLGEKLAGFSAGGAESAGFGSGLLQVFQIEHMLPAWQFQIVVGVYLIQIVFIMSYLLNGIVNGPDKLEEQDMLYKNMLYAVLFYALVTIVSALMFSSLVGGITAAI